MIEAPLAANEAQRLQTLRSLGVLYTPAEDRFDRITRLASRLLRTPIALVTLVGDKVQWFKSVQGIDVNETPRRHSFCAHAILEDDIMVVPNALADERFHDNPLVTGKPFIRFYAGHPLRAADGSKLGTLCVIDAEPRTLGDEDRLALRDLAAIAESELQLQSALQTQRELVKEISELTRKAMLDSLTQLWNRRGIMDILQRELQRAARDRSPVSLMLADVDHFKRVNDTYGHLQGDRVLVEVARRLRSATRAYDAVGRYGGEEFMVVLGDCDEQVAMQAAERIRSQLSRAELDNTEPPVRITISIGVVTAGGDSAVSPKDLIQAADEALYAAKGAGRDRVIQGKL